MSDDAGYYYELRYWKNRFDEGQLAVFMICLERIVEAMLDEPSVRRLKRHLPEEIFPKHYTLTAGTVNRTVGYRLIEDADGDTPVKVYVLDDGCRKQPFGAWGQLYIMDHPAAGWTDKVTNPYGPGTLYQTGIFARILPDGTLDLLDQGGRTVMMERLNGRNFVDLARLEKVLKNRSDISDAKAYIRWGEEHKLVLAADVRSRETLDPAELNEFLEQWWEKSLLPVEFHIVKEE